jgi:hypothetical protein
MKTLVQKAPVRPPTPSPAPAPEPPRARRDEPRGENRPAPGAAHDFASIPVHPPAGGADDALRTARRGVEGAAAPLPHLAAIQRSFGRHDLSGVRALVGGEAAAAGERLRAAAYATGGRVAFRERPTLWTAAHEAAHVVQQRAGVRLDDGVGRAGDPHERHADAVAGRVARGLSAEALLDAYGPAASGEARGGDAAVVQKQAAPPTLAPGATGKYAYTKDGKTTEFDAYQILFLGDGGYDTFAWAKGKGYSTFAALFVVAHAVVESDYGRGNFGARYKNLFSIMGGAAENKGTEHGRLQKFATYEEGLAAYASLLASTWPKTMESATGLYFRTSFTPDDVNQAFRQYGYYNQGGPVYLGDRKKDYGADLFRRMELIAGPFIVVIQQKMTKNAQEMALATLRQTSASDPAEAARWQAEVAKHVDVQRRLRAYESELKTAHAEVKAKFAAHQELKKTGKIPLPR